MPRLPDIDSLGPRPVPQSQRGVARQPAAGIVGDAIAGIGQNLTRIAEARFEKEDRLAYAAAKSAYLTADIAARKELQDDPDYGTFEARYAEKMKAAREAATGLLRSNADRRLFGVEIDTDFARGSAEVATLARGKRVAADKSVLFQGLENLRDVSRDALDEGTRAEAIKSANELIEGARGKGLLDPLEATALREKWASDYAAEQVTLALNREDPAAAAKVLGAFGDKIDWKTRLDLEERLKRVTDFRVASGDFARSAGVPTITGTDAGKVPSLGLMYSAIRSQESRNRQFGSDGKPLTSPKGAVGVMQIMPATGPEAARLAGLPWDADKLRNDPEYNRKLGEAYFKEMLRQFGDPIGAAAAYNAGPGRVRAAMKKGGDWISRLPKETQDYVANFRKNTGYAGAQQGPRRWDKNEVYANIDRMADAEGWTIERRERAKEYADSQIARDEQLAGREEQAEMRSALDVVDKLDDKFTDISQIPNAGKLAPDDRMQLENMAAANRRAQLEATKPDANGDVAITLKVLSARDPETFKTMDLRPFRPFITPSEFESLAVDQAKLRSKPADQPATASLRSEIDTAIRFWGKDIGLDIGERDSTEKRQQYGRVYDLMRTYLDRATEGGKRKPTDDEMKAAFDSATMEVVVRGGGWLGGDTKARRFELDERQKRVGVPIPADTRGRIVASYRRNGIEPTEQQIAETYLQNKGKPGFWK